ncbi:VHL disease, partial [Atractosteus spatula]|nr:VHL disease [Atractosteus spatula]
MAARELPIVLRSLNSDVPTYVTFVNHCGYDARAWWLNFTGDPVSYGDIKPRTRMHMKTYRSHPWVFRASDNGAKLLANMKEIYFPELNDFQDGYPVYLEVMITSPVYSLQDYCIMLVQKLVKKKDFDKLDIPQSLKKDLKEFPNLQKELRDLNRVLQAIN